MKVRPREAADQVAAEAFLARHYSLRAARLGELVHPLDHPALVAETADGQLLGMLTYVPGRDWQECEILTLHADEQWRGAGRSPWWAPTGSRCATRSSSSEHPEQRAP
jgi:hypothetical protein